MAPWCSQAQDTIQRRAQLGRWVRALHTCTVYLHPGLSLLRVPGGSDSLVATGMLPAQAWSSHISKV